MLRVQRYTNLFIMETNGQRISQVITKLYKSKADFARKIGERPQTISNWCTRQNSSSVIDKIVKACPEINITWLLTGEGNMLNEMADIATPSEPNGNAKQAMSEYETYLLPMSVMGGSLVGLPTEGTMLEQCERVISPIKGIDFAISIYGESMYPEYPSGARVLIKRVNPDIFIEWGKVYVLDTSNGVIIKEIHQSPREGFITCHSINPDPKFADFDVPMAEIYGMYRVLMCLAAK